jgi:hypothetical protein
LFRGVLHRMGEMWEGRVIIAFLTATDAVRWSMLASSEIPLSVRQLATVLADPQPMRRGSVSERMIKCGKTNCACADDPKSRHGPYYSLTQAVSGKTRSRFLSPEQAAVAQQQIAAGREFREHVETYREACEDWADAQLEIPTTASSGEAQKGGSRRTSKTTSSRRSKPS